jgi:hypothetical protein
MGKKESFPEIPAEHHNEDNGKVNRKCAKIAHDIHKPVAESTAKSLEEMIYGCLKHN